MSHGSGSQRRLLEHVERRQDRLVDIARQLIRIPSENTPPSGAEAGCQSWIAQRLSDCGITPDVYELAQVNQLEQHALFREGRDYRDRPNVGARRTGSGGGRSLLLSGHIDTVPVGTQSWTRNPFSAEVEENRLYGRGANDMKAGVAINLFMLECLAELDIKLKGDILFETVVDEEFGGCNGTLAGRLRGYNADAVILSEPTSLRVCPAQRGGRTAHLTFHAASGGVLQSGRFPSGVAPQLACFFNALPGFAAKRSGVHVHELYAANADPVPVSVTKIVTAPWGFQEPINIPDIARVELYWQTMPGETQSEVEREFFAWLHAMVDANRSVFSAPPDVEFPIRWLPGSAIAIHEPLVRMLASCAEQVTRTKTQIAGIEGPCDLFVFQQYFQMSAVLWGPHGGNTHAADEYVEIESMVSAAKALLLFTTEFCGVQ